jgi:xanthine permease XanP
MSRKPAGILCLAGDVPPAPVVIVSALQYVAVTSSFLVFPLIIVREAQLAPAAADAMLGWAMLVLALGTTLQALPFGPVGSGYLAPSVMTAVFLGPSVEAVRIGGIALMSGMKPSIDEMVAGDDGLRRMSSYLLGKRARSLTTSRDKDVCNVMLHFDN